uniref:mannose-6-phosphate isomerase n=1 Tax=Ascaris lumbricoides TaxID=6252 RepID=A0A0M3I424_ASCLU
MKPEKLIYRVQNYEWGRLGKNSIVASLKQAADHDFAIEENKPYAELWMGVHPNGPSVLASSGESLSDYIISHPSSLGAHEDGTLNFLFKALSVNKALSIQSHPNKEQAKVLHARDPAHYPDDNHKPEMMIALTDFQLLCGFRPPDEIFANIKATPELLAFVKDGSIIEQLKAADEGRRRDALRQIFSDFMKSPADSIASAVAQMIARLKNKSTRTPLDDLLIRLDTEFPGDVGVFAALLLNYFTLKKGESVFLGPNQPHAYLLGDCIECMAGSDNTVRAGLTPKFKDVQTLCSDLTFQMSPPPYFESRRLSDSVTEYAPPVSEFAVHEIKGGTDSLWDLKASSIMLLTNGSAQLFADGEQMNLARGEAIFIPADAEVVILLPETLVLASRSEDVRDNEDQNSDSWYRTKGIYPSRNFLVLQLSPLTRSRLTP